MGAMWESLAEKHGVLLVVSAAGFVHQAAFEITSVMSLVSGMLQQTASFSAGRLLIASSSSSSSTGGVVSLDFLLGVFLGGGQEVTHVSGTTQKITSPEDVSAASKS